MDTAEREPYGYELLRKLDQLEKATEQLASRLSYVSRPIDMKLASGVAAPTAPSSILGNSLLEATKRVTLLVDKLEGLRVSLEW